MKVLLCLFLTYFLSFLRTVSDVPISINIDVLDVVLLGSRQSTIGGGSFEVYRWVRINHIYDYDHCTVLDLSNIYQETFF